MLQVSYSALSTWRRCHQAWHYRYRLLWANRTPDTKMQTGVVFHDVISRYHCLPVDERTHAAMYYFLDQAIAASKFTGQQERQQKPLLRAMVDAYWQSFGSDYDIQQLVNGETAEATFEIPLLTNQEGETTVSLCGRVDGVIERNGEKWILEHKTGNPDQAHYALLDEQGALYCYALGAVGVIHTFTTQPTARSYAECTRFETEKTELEIKHAVKDATATATEIRSIPALYRARGYQCKWCDYRLICVGVLSGANEQEIIEDNYTKELPEWMRQAA